MKNANDVQISQRVRDYLYLEMILTEEYMTAPILAELISITERQLSYWDSKRLKLVERQKKDHKWKRYSVFDIFGFGVVKMLKRQGITLKTSEAAIIYLRTALRKYISLFKHLALGKYVYLTFDNDMPDLIFSDMEIREFERNLLNTKPSSIFIPLHLIMRFALENAHKDGFTIKFVRNKHDTGDKAVFNIKDDRFGIMTIDFDDTE